MTGIITALDPMVLRRAAAIIKCLGHPLRLLILEALEGGERTVTELQTETGATQAMVSQQLATLRGHGVVSFRRDGPCMRYAISEPKVHHILDCIRACDAMQAAGAPEARGMTEV